MVNVVSFCLYGSRATYVLGMRENIILGKKFYPGWEIRIYYNSTVPEKYISEYSKLGAKCIKCENLGKNKMNWEGMVWRFLPLDDTKVHYWISRDADSRLSKREAYTVAQWMRSGKTLHCIRDHRCHYHAIMGGLFGINNQSFHKKYRFKKISAIISDLYGYYRERPYNVDQEFLNNQLWKLLKNDSLAHISNGGRRIYASDIAIPSAPDFIGKQYRIADTPSIDNDSDSDSSNKINIINKQFKIKSVYNDYCLDIENEKVKLKIISDECTSQQWKMDDKHRIIHCDTNKFLDFDNSKDLIISTNGKNTWSIREGGFIQNNSNNMAIDIKGGLKDKRREAWLYKINYSEAQQWDLQNGSKNEISEDCNEIKNYNEINYDNIFPITTSIPSEVFVTDIDDIIKNKKVDIYDGIKNRPVGARYEFNTEKEYYNAYKEAKWGFTKKKNGWDCLRHYEIVANGCLPLFENLENCPETILDSFPKKLLLEAKNKKNTMSDKEYNYYLKTIFDYFKENLTCEIVAERFLKKIHRDNKKKLSEVKILLLHGNECNNYMADMLFIGLRRLLNENIVDEKKLVQLYKSFSGNAYGKGFTYTKKLSDELMIDRNNIEEKIKNKFYDYVIYRKCGGDEGELGDCRKKMEYWDLVEKKYSPNEIVFLYGGDTIVNEGQENYLLNHLRYHSHKGLCFVREFTATETSNYKNFINNPYINEQSKTIVVLNHNFHHKNKKGLEIICDYLGYNLVYGTEQDIPDADVIYCPSRPFNAGKYPNKRFVFGPHLSIFPDNKLRSIQNKDNSVYIQPSPWARDVWINWKSMDTESLIPVKSFPFPVEVDLFKPEPNAVKENIFIMFKHRNPKELKFIENYLNNNKVSYKTFRYGGYKQDDYIKYLKTCKYGIWIGRHESQGFALEESLSCNVPLLVWNVSNMRQQHGWNGCPDVYGITIPFWDKTCGEYFYKEEEFEETYNKFLKNLDNYSPREFILNTVSVKQCAENFKKVFLNIDCKMVNDNKTLQPYINNELYFDIGANVGLWAIANSKENRRIISVEASPTTFNKLKEKTKNNKNIECLNFAVTDSKDNTITFYEHNWDTISTLNKDWLTSSKSRFCNTGNINETKVNTISINKLIEQYGVPDLIKIDVEGGEFQVCKSLSNNSVNILNFEWASEMYDITEKSLNYLSTIGYNKFHIQTGDEYTYIPKEFEYDLDTVKDILSKKIPRKDMGMVWCTTKDPENKIIKQYLDSPYKEIPAELLSKYTLRGKIPILDLFDDGRKALLNQNWDDAYIGKYKNLFSNENIKRQISLWKHEPYPYDKASYNVLMSVEKYNIHNKKVAIIGTTIPWIEAILLNNNNNITTVEYNVPKCNVDNITCIHYDDFVKSNTTYDCIFSYSSTEHCGLGRYGDPLDPDGDLTAMKHIYDKLGKDSYLFWGGPVGKDTLVWNVHRIYGPLRLSMLFEGFNDVEWMGFNKQNLFNSPINKLAKQPLVVLKKTSIKKN